MIHHGGHGLQALYPLVCLLADYLAQVMHGNSVP